MLSLDHFMRKKREDILY